MIKIRNEGRTKKRDNLKKKNEYNNITPPKYTEKSSMLNTVKRLQKKFGYDFDSDNPELSNVLKVEKQKFENNAIKYCGGGFGRAKKMNRFDKMRVKEEMGFTMQQFPIKKLFRRVDEKITFELKRQAMQKLLRL